MPMIFQRQGTNPWAEGFSVLGQTLGNTMFGRTTDQRLEDQYKQAQIEKLNVDRRAAEQNLQTQRDILRATREAEMAARSRAQRRRQASQAWEPAVPVEPVAVNPGGDPLRGQAGAIPTPIAKPVDERFDTTHTTLSYLNPAHTKAVLEAQAAREAEALVRSNVANPVLQAALLRDPTKIMDADTRMLALQGTPGAPTSSGYSPMLASKTDESMAMQRIRQINYKKLLADRGEGPPLTEHELNDYRDAHAILTMKKQELRTDPVTKQQTMVTYGGQAPQGIVNPDILAQSGARVGGAPAASAISSPGAAGPVQTQDAARAAAQGEVEGFQAPLQVIRGPAGDITVQPLGPVRPLKRTELQSKTYLAGQRLGMDIPAIADAVGYDVSTGKIDAEANENFSSLYNAAMLDVLEVGQQGGYTAQYLTKAIADPKLGVYHAAIKSALNTIIRIDSGAAVPLTEYPQYAASLIPVPGDPPEVVEFKMRKLQLHLRAYEIMSDSDMPLNNDEWIDSAEGVKARRAALDMAAQEMGAERVPLFSANKNGVVVGYVPGRESKPFGVPDTPEEAATGAPSPETAPVPQYLEDGSFGYPGME